ncbi:MAG: hypothetical protein HPY66_2090 [Firmicutes bacterium]|nr:hypothetical protein [Bacillota bacterium]
MRLIFRPALVAALSLVVFIVASCSHEGGDQLERIERLGSWEKKEAAYKDIVSSSGDRILVSRAIFSLVEGYLEQGKRADAETYYGKLKSTTRPTNDEIEKAEIYTIASRAAGILAESYMRSMDYFKASGYIEEEINFLESFNQNISDQLLVLIDLHTKTCSYDKALAVFDKWSNLYGDAFPELAEATKSKLIDSTNISEVGT